MMTVNNLTDEQKELLIQTAKGNNVLVDACIGSGKTTAIQVLCNVFHDRKILYLTYNKLLKIDARQKIRNRNVTVTNYHGFAYMCLAGMGIRAGISDLIQSFNKHKPPVQHYDILVLDEYQDIEQEIADMLVHIKSQNPDIQIVAVGDMKQKIYDKTTLQVLPFMEKFLGNYKTLHFTQCFRLSSALAGKLGRIWEKQITGVNPKCRVESMTVDEVTDFLSMQLPENILCLGSRTGAMAGVLNKLEEQYPKSFNKATVYASIRDDDRDTYAAPSEKTAIFTTYDSSKGLERKICVIFDYTEEYWTVRIGKPMTKYEILRNIFCVAASRGKERIIFVTNPKNKKGETPLSEKTLSTVPKEKEEKSAELDISEMFSFKYKEDVEDCYRKLSITQIPMADNRTIQIKGTDEMIDLSPCIGIFQEAVFFDGYDIDREISYAQAMHSDRPPLRIREGAGLEEKILYLTAYNTYQDRYVTQVRTPFISQEQTYEICDRLASVFTHDENVQKTCAMHISDRKGKDIFIDGKADVVKNNCVYELKFVSELQHEHFLQCACYMVAMDLPDGILWNVKTNQMYAVSVPDRKDFMSCVVNAVTKGNSAPLKISVGAETRESRTNEKVMQMIKRKGVSV